MSSTDSCVSLIDLRKQIQFKIDEEIKKHLCFAETLIISCTHYEGNIEDEGRYQRNGSQDTVASDMVCRSTTKSSSTINNIEDQQRLIRPSEPVPENEIKGKDDLSQLFFLASNKDNKQSVIKGPEDTPLINPNAEFSEWCRCKTTKNGPCECFLEIPCKCGAKQEAECTCGNLKEICFCDEKLPAKECNCNESKYFCTCFGGMPRVPCTCDTVKKPCICDNDKYPFPVCQCKYKPWRTPKFGSPVGNVEVRLPVGLIESREWEWGEGEDETSSKFSDREMDLNDLNKIDSIESEFQDFGTFVSEEQEKTEEEQRRPCPCQEPDPNEMCLCRRGDDCLCFAKGEGLCGAQDLCTCSSDSIMPSDTINICKCAISKTCTCGKNEDECACFPETKECACGDPENCKCQKVCDCKGPCICDIQLKPDECICLDPERQIKDGNVFCICPRHKKPHMSLKKVRKGKKGYIHCPDIDPYHTYFDYAYDKHHLIEQKGQEKEKFKILGLHDEIDEICPVHGTTSEQIPRFRKRVRKPSLDCCSTVGGLTISVEALGEYGDKFLVHVISHASKEGAKTGSKLVSIVDLNLHTLEENRDEYITKKDMTKELKSYMAICDVGYYNKVIKTCGERESVKRLYHEFEHAKEFLLEGANIILMRYLALIRHRGSIKTRAVLLEGTICQNIYVCHGTSHATVNGKMFTVVKIERHIIEPDGTIHQTLTVLSLRGHMISHEWHDNNYVLHINPLLRVFPEKDLIEEHAPLRERWREDMQLFSDFLDHKAQRTAEGTRYIQSEIGGGLTSTVKDYLQAILLLKPNDVIHFTRHYFESVLSSMDLPRDPYFEPCHKHVRYFYMEN